VFPNLALLKLRRLTLSPRETLSPCGFGARAATFSSLRPFDPDAIASDPDAMGRAGCCSGRALCGGCARALVATSTFALSVWKGTERRALRAVKLAALRATVCSFALQPRILISTGGVTASAAEPWAWACGHTSVRSARSIFVRRVLQVGFSQSTYLALLVLHVRELGSLLLTGRAGGRRLKGLDPRGALLMAGRTQKSPLHRPLRAGHAAGAVSGPGNPSSCLVARQGGLSDSLTVRDRGVSAAPHLIYIRAGKVCERELARPSLSSDRSGVSVFVRRAFVVNPSNL
jgi:hypothetical protein